MENNNIVLLILLICVIYLLYRDFTRTNQITEPFANCVLTEAGCNGANNYLPSISNLGTIVSNMISNAGLFTVNGLISNGPTTISGNLVTTGNATINGYIISPGQIIKTQYYSAANGNWSATIAENNPSWYNPTGIKSIIYGASYITAGNGSINIFGRNPENPITFTFSPVAVDSFSTLIIESNFRAAYNTTVSNVAYFVSIMDVTDSSNKIAISTVFNFTIPSNYSQNGNFIRGSVKIPANTTIKNFQIWFGVYANIPNSSIIMDLLNTNVLIQQLND